MSMAILSKFGTTKMSHSTRDLMYAFATSLLQAHTFTHIYMGNSSLTYENKAVLHSTAACGVIRGHSKGTHNCNTDKILKRKNQPLLWPDIIHTNCK